MPDVSVHHLDRLTTDARENLLTRAEGDLGPFLEKVGPIIEAVRTEGDEALARFAREFDKSPVTATLNTSNTFADSGMKIRGRSASVGNVSMVSTRAFTSSI
ncbi:MAG: hypothetical protein AAFW98_09240, partial [Pseudomonadota bacterium]